MRELGDHRHPQPSGISRNTCPPSVGTGVRDRVESVSVIDRMTQPGTHPLASAVRRCSAVESFFWSLAGAGGEEQGAADDGGDYSYPPSDGVRGR